MAIIIRNLTRSHFVIKIKIKALDLHLLDLQLISCRSSKRVDLTISLNNFCWDCSTSKGLTVYLPIHYYSI